MNKTSEAGIRELLDELTEALRAKDSGRVVRLYAPESVQFLLAPPLLHRSVAGVDRAGLERWFDTFRGPIAYRFHELEITTRADVAFAHGLVQLQGTKADGAEVQMWLRVTTCFQKSARGWQIVHQHESVPFYMDGSLKAAIDLTP